MSDYGMPIVSEDDPHFFWKLEDGVEYRYYKCFGCGKERKYKECSLDVCDVCGEQSPMIFSSGKTDEVVIAARNGRLTELHKISIRVRIFDKRYNDRLIADHGHIVDDSESLAVCIAKEAADFGKYLAEDGMFVTDIPMGIELRSQTHKMIIELYDSDRKDCRYTPKE